MVCNHAKVFWQLEWEYLLYLTGVHETALNKQVYKWGSPWTVKEMQKLEEMAAHAMWVTLLRESVTRGIHPEFVFFGFGEF